MGGQMLPGIMSSKNPRDRFPEGVRGEDQVIDSPPSNIDPMSLSTDKLNCIINKNRHNAGLHQTIKCFEQLEASLTIQQKLLKEKTENIQAELKILQDLEKEQNTLLLNLEKVKEEQNVLYAPLLIEMENLQRSIKKSTATYENWLERKKSAEVKTSKEKERLDNLNVWIQNQGVEFVRTNSQNLNEGINTLKFWKINPKNPDAEYTITFSQLDWHNLTSFKVESAQPTFPEFETLAKEANSTNNLLNLILSCLECWKAKYSCS